MTPDQLMIDTALASWRRVAEASETFLLNRTRPLSYHLGQVALARN